MNENSNPSPAPAITGFKKWGTLLILSLALAIIIIDSSVLNVSIANLIRDLNTDVQSMQWVIAIYSLVLGAFTITGGRLGDLFGRKKMFVLGALIFAAGSLIASLSQNVTTLLIGWSIIEGLGAALMMPATSSLLISNFKGRDRAIAFGVWGSIAGAAASFGPIFGGYLTTNVSWHWAFRINVFVVALLVLGAFIIKESRDNKEKPNLDIVGVILSSLSMFLIVFGIIQSSTYGWLQAKQVFTLFGTALSFGGISVVAISVTLGLLILAAFVWWQIRLEKQGKTPLVSMKLFVNRQFSAGIVTTTVLALGQAGMFFSLPVFLQAVLKLSAFDTGVALLPLSLSILVVAPIGAVLSKRITPKVLVIVGLTIGLLGSVLLREEITSTVTVTQLIPSLVLFGVGFGIVSSQITNITLSAVHIFQAGEASGVNATARQIGSTLGSAIIGAVFLSTFTAGLITGVNQSTIIPDQAKSSIVSTVQDSGSQLEFGGAQSIGGSSQLPAPVTNEIVTLVNNSTVEGNKDALLVTAGFSLLSILAAFALPNNKNLERSTEVVAGH